MLRKALLVSCAISAMPFLLAACNLAPGEDVSQPAVGEEAPLPSAEAVVIKAIESLKEVKTYRFASGMRMDMSAEADGETFDGAVVMELGGEVDLKSRRLRLEMSASIAVPGQPEVELGTEMYLMGDTAYASVDVPAMGEGPIWVKSKAAGGLWEKVGQLESQIELLELSEVEVIGTDSVGGVECYLLEVTPDVERLWELAVQQAKAGAEDLPGLSLESAQNVIRSSSVRQWIAKDSFFLLRSDIEMSVEVTPATMGLPDLEGSMTMDVAISFLAYDHNRPLTIMLPLEALTAAEVSSAETQEQAEGSEEEPPTGAPSAPDEEPSEVTFQVTGWETVSDVDPLCSGPRAYLVVRFSSTAPVKLTLVGPEGAQVGQSHRVTEGTSSVRIPMTSACQETPAPGTYSVEVSLWTGEAVTRLEVASFQGAELLFERVRFPLVRGAVPSSAVVQVTNRGDLPAYVAQVDVRMGDAQHSLSYDGGGISPLESDLLTLEWPSSGDRPAAAAVSAELVLRDAAGNAVGTYTGEAQLTPWQTYSASGWAITYPDGWLVTDLDSKVTIAEPEGAVQVTVETVRAPGYQLDQWVDQLVATRKSEWVSFELLSDQSLDWEGVPARRLAWTGRERGGEPLRGDELCFKQGDLIYSVRGTAPESAYPFYAVELEAIIQSLAIFQ